MLAEGDGVLEIEDHPEMIRIGSHAHVLDDDRSRRGP